MDYKEVFEWKTVHNGHGITPNIRASTASWNYKNGLWIVCGAGSGQGKSSEVWKYDLEQNKWLKIDALGESPPSRDGHSGTYIGNGKFVIFGGQGFAEKNNKLGKEGEQLRTQTYCKREVLNDLWVFDCEKLEWSPVYPDGLSVPMGRRGHSAIFIPPADHADSGAAGDTMSYAGSMAFTTSTNTHNTSMAHLSQPSLHAGDTSSLHTSSRTARDAATPPPNTAAVGAERIPDNALLVFGGAGIELSKYSEQLYNELWSFSFTTNLWSRHATRGVEPPCLCDHRAERVGDHMLVIGGLAPHRLDSGSTVGPQDLLSLHLPSSTWSTVPLSDPRGGRRGLGLHGFSLVADVHGGRLWIFGGGEVVDCRTAASTRSPLRRNAAATDDEEAPIFTVHVKDRVLTTMFAAGTTPPPRYAHATFSGQSADLSSDPVATGSAMDTRLALARQSDDSITAPRTLLFVFGGVRLAGGGYCDPSLFALTSTLVAEGTPSQGGRGARGGQRERPREPASRFADETIGPAGSLGGDAMDTIETGRGSIWDSLQARATYANGGAYVARRDPSTWAELKLALSSSRSQRLFDPLPVEGARGSPLRGGGAGDAAAGGRSRRAPAATETHALSAPRSPQRLLNLPEFGVRSTHSNSRGRPMSPWQLPSLGVGLSPGAGLEQGTLAAPSAFSAALGGAGRLSSQSLAVPSSSSHTRGLRSQSTSSPRHSASHASLAHSHSHSPHGSAERGSSRQAVPDEEVEAATAERRRQRIAEIKRSLRPLISNGQSKCATRERFKELFPCDYSNL